MASTQSVNLHYMSVSHIRANLHVISKDFSAYLLRNCSEGYKLWSKSRALSSCRYAPHYPILPCIDRRRYASNLRKHFPNTDLPRQADYRWRVFPVPGARLSPPDATSLPPEPLWRAKHGALKAGAMYTWCKQEKTREVHAVPDEAVLTSVTNGWQRHMILRAASDYPVRKPVSS